MQAVLAAVVGIAIVVWVIDSAMRPLNRDDIRIAAGDLRSLTAESRDLIKQHSSGQLTQTFFEQQRSFIADAADSERDPLASGETEPQFDADRIRVTTLAERLSDVLRSAGSSSAGEPATAGEIESISTELAKVEEELKRSHE